MKRFHRAVVIVLALVSSAEIGRCSVSVGTNLFSRGRTRLSVYGGAAGAFNQTYGLLGLGAGYYIANGLEAGVDGEMWFGNDPKIYKITPQVRYVLYQAPRLKPYIGGFYRRTIYEGLDDLNSYGGRVGVFSPLGGRGYAGFGLVYEKLVNCNTKTYSSCDSTYPEVSFSIGF